MRMCKLVFIYAHYVLPSVPLLNYKNASHQLVSKDVLVFFFYASVPASFRAERERQLFCMKFSSLFAGTSTVQVLYFALMVSIH